MILFKKKDILRELAVSLFLTLEFNPDITSASLIRRIRDRAKEALQAAATYTGLLGQNEVQDFLQSEPFRFSIACKDDIIKGDIIRFTEDVYNGRVKPPRRIGKRTVSAEVKSLRASGQNTMLLMRVIECGGVWELEPDSEIRRTLKNIARQDVMRVAWTDEASRDLIKQQPNPEPKAIKQAAAEAFATRRNKP